MQKSASAPEIHVSRTRGATRSEPTLEETYAAAVQLHKHGRGQLGDENYIRKGNKAACAREANCDIETFNKILQGESLVGTDGRTAIYSKEDLDKMKSKAEVKDRRGDSYTSDGRAFMADLNKVAGKSSNTSAAPEVSDATKWRVMKLVVPDNASGCYKTLERSRQMADLRNALSCIFVFRQASKDIDPRLTFGWDDMSTILYSFADKPKLRLTEGMKKELKAKNQQPATQQKQSQRRSITVGFLQSGSYELPCTVVRIYDDNFKFTTESSLVDVQWATEAFGTTLSSSSSSSNSSRTTRMDVEQSSGASMEEVPSSSSSSSSSSSQAQEEAKEGQQARRRTAEAILVDLV